MWVILYGRYGLSLLADAMLMIFSYRAVRPSCMSRHTRINNVHRWCRDLVDSSSRTCPNGLGSTRTQNSSNIENGWDLEIVDVYLVVCQCRSVSCMCRCTCIGVCVGVCVCVWGGVYVSTGVCVGGGGFEGCRLICCCRPTLCSVCV